MVWGSLLRLSRGLLASLSSSQGGFGPWHGGSDPGRCGFSGRGGPGGLKAPEGALYPVSSPVVPAPKSVGYANGLGPADGGMDSHEVKEALSARAKTTTLDELKSQGKKKVKVIKAGDIAAIVSSAVRKALESSGLVSEEEVENLVRKSREEFQSILKEREEEVRQAREVKEKLQTVEEERNQLKEKLESAPAMAQGGAPMSGDLSAALDKMASTLNERLDKFGKKMGISSAVEGADVNLEGLFKDDTADLESNMDDVTVKQRTGRGIAANLERLKKLKGGGS